jgi:hypothetical protein
MAIPAHVQAIHRAVPSLIPTASVIAEPAQFPVAVLALAPTDLTVDSPKVSALFDLLAPPLHMAGLGVVLP